MPTQSLSEIEGYQHSANTASSLNQSSTEVFKGFGEEFFSGTAVDLPQPLEVSCTAHRLGTPSCASLFPSQLLPSVPPQSSSPVPSLIDSIHVDIRLHGN